MTPPPSIKSPLLEVRGLHIAFPTCAGSLKAVQDVSFDLHAGQTLALLGESGCGKSTLGRALLGLLSSNGIVESGHIGFPTHDRINFACSPNHDWRRLRGRVISLILQDPVQALNPVLRVGVQIDEALQRRERNRQKKLKTLEMLRLAGFDDPDRIYRSYPSQLSGGMNQRVSIVAALINGPSILVADEPTTALDVRVQGEILGLIRNLQADLRLGLILISHDLAVAVEMADQLAVMYAGRFVETGPAAAVMNHPRHPYTKALLRCFPDPSRSMPLPLEGAPPALVDPSDHCQFLPRCLLAGPDCHDHARPNLQPYPGEPANVHRAACHYLLDSGNVQSPSIPPRSLDLKSSAATLRTDQRQPPVLEVRNLVKIFRGRSAFLGRTTETVALNDASFSMGPGEIVGLVGESGCGKTTLARCILGLEAPSSGRISLNGIDVLSLRSEAWRQLRRVIQPVFQNSRGSLNSTKTALDLVQEPLDYFQIDSTAQRMARARNILDMVALPRDAHQRRPDELSTGQCQRVAIARALVIEPSCLICDEPVSALDLSVQAQIINLLAELNQQLHFCMLFISHNLSVVRMVSHRVLVMYGGCICENMDAAKILDGSRHPYTRALIAALPRLQRRAYRQFNPRQVSTDNRHQKESCPFHRQCQFADRKCRNSRPPMIKIDGNHTVACFHPDRLVSK